MASSPARIKLEEAEKWDRYLAALQASDSNRLARLGTSYTPFFVEPAIIDPVLRIIESIELLDGTDTIVMHPTAEHGFPHTRPGNLICLPSKCIDPSNVSLETMAETLRHEAVHIHQRRQPELWSLTSKKEGWSAVIPDLIPANLRENCRINPDTFLPTPFWAWETYTVPLPLFVQKPRYTLADCVVKWYDLRNGVLYRDPPPSFLARYGRNPPQPEHPFELLAVEAARENIETTYLLESKLNSK